MGDLPTHRQTLPEFQMKPPSLRVLAVSTDLSSSHSAGAEDIGRTSNFLP